MSAPWIFQQTKHFLATGEIVDVPELRERWNLIQRHCEFVVREWGVEDLAIRSMRARLMAYSKSMPEAKRLRERFSHVSSLAEIEAIAQESIFRSDAATGEAVSPESVPGHTFPHSCAGTT